MCGRFALTIAPADLQTAFEWVDFGDANFLPRYNIAPTQSIAVVTNTEENKGSLGTDGVGPVYGGVLRVSPHEIPKNPNRLNFFTWGLVPFWAKDPSISSRMINARAETLTEKPSFKNAFKRRRCLILADGFYEWQKIPGEQAKIPTYIHMKDSKPFAFAGLWEEWNSPDGSQILSAAIITTSPNELVKPIHNRMPVILPTSTYGEWLMPGEADTQRLAALLRPFDAKFMEAYPVSRMVNNPRNDTPNNIKPL